MTNFLLLRDRISSFYTKYEMVLRPLLKFFYACLCIGFIDMKIGYMGLAKNPFVILVAALFCAFLPWGAGSIMSGAFLLWNLSAVSQELTVVMTVLFLVSAVIMGAFKPGYTVLLSLFPIMFFIRLPYIVPIVAGMCAGLSSIIPCILGTILYFMISYCIGAIPTLTEATAGIEGMLIRYADILNGLLENKYAMVMVVSFSLCITTVYIVRRMSISYARELAVLLGGIVMFAVILVGSISFGISGQILEAAAGIVICVPIAAVYSFFMFSMDYSRVEHVQFEDEDYYYYVKAVPKMRISKKDIQVANITKE